MYIFRMLAFGTRQTARNKKVDEITSLKTPFRSTVRRTAAEVMSCPSQHSAMNITYDQGYTHSSKAGMKAHSC